MLNEIYAALRRFLTLACCVTLYSCSGATETLPPPSVATSVVALSPTAFSGVAGQPVGDRPSVVVRDQRSDPMPGVVVTFTISAGSGTLTGETATTNATGSASPGGWTLGTVAGANVLTATAAGVTVPVSFTATGNAGPASKLTVTPSSYEARGRVDLSTPPVVQLQDQYANPVAQPGISITVNITNGGGTLAGSTVVVTSGSGAAIFAALSIAGTVGTRTLAFSSGLLTPASATVVLKAGVPAGIAVNAGNNQSAVVGTDVATPPSARVTDADANPVAGVAVSFVLVGGGGTITGGSATTNEAGIATVERWTLGASPGANTVRATAAGVGSATAIFNATGVQPSLVSITTITPATLTPGGTMTLSGTGFSATSSGNAVTVDGVSATVTSSSPSQINVSLPTTFACNPIRDVSVAVKVGTEVASKQQPLRTATARTLGVGQALLTSSAAEARCNELPAGGGRYLVSVYNGSRTYSPTPTAFELRGATTAGAYAVRHAVADNSLGMQPKLVPLADLQRSTREEGERLHHRVLEENIAILSRNRPLLRTRRGASGASAARASVGVGDTVPIRIPKIRGANFCTNYHAINARVAYVGTRSLVLEDLANPMSGQIDSTYASIGQEFDASMFPILEQNFGNPLAMDAVTAQTGKVAMVFSSFVNDSIPGVGGFVVACDFFPQATFPSSNFGQVFYGTSPTVAGGFATTGSPSRWRWTMRSTVIHEAKHVTSFAERISRNASVFEESWLEESTARVSEELYERARYGFAQRSNIGYGSASNPVGPYCGVRSNCNQARGFVKAFEDLTLNFYQKPEIRSPLGRLNADDFSFYATGWSLVRWMLDNATQTESSLLRGLIQATSVSGLANIEARAGRSFADMQPEWLMSMVLDDRPGFASANSRINFPSWDMRNVLEGLNRDFPSNYTSPFPFTPVAATFGDFVASGSVVSGTGFFAELSGQQNLPQVLELRSAAGVAAPSQLRLAIVRVQ